MDADWNYFLTRRLVEEERKYLQVVADVIDLQDPRIPNARYEFLSDTEMLVYTEFLPTYRTFYYLEGMMRLTVAQYEGIIDQVWEFMDDMASMGVAIKNLHGDDVMVCPETGDIKIIDWQLYRPWDQEEYDIGREYTRERIYCKQTVSPKSTF